MSFVIITTGSSAGVVDATKHGVSTTGSTNAAALQALHDGLSGPATLFLPPGQYNWERPFFRWKPGVSIRGVSAPESRILAGGSFPVIVDGVSPACTDGFTYGNSHNRPDLFGVVDSSLSSGTGAAWGFSTSGGTGTGGGRSAGYLTGHGLACGKLVSGDWDYYGTVNALTVRCMLLPGSSGRIPAGPAGIFGMGDVQFQCAYPWFFATGIDASAGQGVAGIYFQMAGDTVCRRAWATYGDPTVPHRFLWAIDGVGGAVTCRVDGVSKTVTYGTSGDGNIAGKTFARSSRGYPFQFGDVGSISLCGTGASVPDVVIAGMAAYASYLPNDPNTDLLRYKDSTGTCLGCFWPTSKEPGRLLFFENGAASGGLYSRAVVLDSLSGNALMSGSATSDLTVFNAGVAHLAASTYDLTVRDVIYRGGVQGFTRLRVTGGTYYTAFDRCEFGGTDSGLSLFQEIAKAETIKFSRGGARSATLVSTSLNLSGAMFTGFSAAPEHAVALLGGGYAGLNSWEDLTGDNEGVSPFGDSFLYAEQQTLPPTSLFIKNVSAGAMASSSSFIHLVGYAPASGNYSITPYVEANGVCCPPGPASLLKVDGPANVWAGTVTTVSSTHNSAGAGLGRVNVVTP